MSYLQFIASLIGSLAWPVAGVIIVVIFKDQLRHILSQVRKFGAAGVNFELSDQLREVQKAGEAVELEQKDEPRDVSVLDPQLMILAQSFPEAAVLQSYKSLEAVLLRIRQRLPDDKPHRNLSEVLNALANDNQISQSVISLFQSLRQARNTAAHGKSGEKLTQGEAVELISQMKNLEDLLEAVLNKMPPKSNRI
jgi:Domain of unknown function (DUF4145)